MSRIWCAVWLNNAAWFASSGTAVMNMPWVNPCYVDYCFAGAAVCALLGLGGLALATRRPR